MKYLKKYKVFEKSFNSLIYQDLNDILFDLDDSDVEYKIHYYHSGDWRDYHFKTGNNVNFESILFTIYRQDIINYKEVLSGFIERISHFVSEYSNEIGIGYWKNGKKDKRCALKIEGHPFERGLDEEMESLTMEEFIKQCSEYKFVEICIYQLI